MATVKLSICFFYLRLASSEGYFRATTWGTIIFLTVFWVVTMLGSTLQCIPVESNWDFSGLRPKKCFNTLAYFYCEFCFLQPYYTKDTLTRNLSYSAIASINILVDIWILLLPVRTLIGIKRPRSQKLGLLAIFGIGGFACVAS